MLRNFYINEGNIFTSDYIVKAPLQNPFSFPLDFLLE